MRTMVTESTQVLALTGVWMITGFCIMFVTAMLKIFRNVPFEETDEFVTYWSDNLHLENGNVWKKIDLRITNLMLWPRTMYLMLSSIDEALVDWKRDRSL